MYLTEGTHRVWIVSISLHRGCCIRHWGSVDTVSGVFGLLLLPHRRLCTFKTKPKKEKAHYMNEEKKKRKPKGPALSVGCF